MLHVRSIGFVAAVLLVVSSQSFGQTPQVPGKSLPSPQAPSKQLPLAAASLRNACGYQTTICKSSPIPAGFVIVGQQTDFSCSSDLNNAWLIQRYNTCPIGQQITICMGQDVPSGWVIKATVTNFNCGSSLNNAWRIERVN